jgi:Protein of unknown function (DUF3046)
VQSVTGWAGSGHSGDNRPMRLTDFWERMRVAFGPHAESLAENHVFSQLDGRTIREALAAGEQPKTIWRGVCEGLEVPAHQR